MLISADNIVAYSLAVQCGDTNLNLVGPCARQWKFANRRIGLQSQSAASCLQLSSPRHLPVPALLGNMASTALNQGLNFNTAFNDKVRSSNTAA
jgi:hypothetical protein